MVPRTNPYIYVTWLSPLLVGERSCEWAVWFQSHNKLDEKATSFDEATWKAEHTPHVAAVRARLEAEGYVVYQEDQNAFKLTGKTGAELHGKPDLIAISEDGKEGIICDAKTGVPRDSHPYQVLTYMWAVPRAFARWSEVEFSGRVAYKEDDVVVPSSAITEDFRRNLTSLIGRVASNTEAIRVPSGRECAFCPVTARDYSERIEGGVVAAGTVTDF